MNFKTIVGNLVLINSQTISLSTLSRDVIFHIEDIKLTFRLVDKDESEATSNYDIERGKQSITFLCNIFTDKSTKFAVTKKPAKLAVIKGEQIYFSFIFERKKEQPVYQISINFFKEDVEHSNFSVGEGNYDDEE